MRYQELPGGLVAKTPRVPNAGAWVPSLVRELRSHLPQLRVYMLQLKKIEKDLACHNEDQRSCLPHKIGTAK